MTLKSEASAVTGSSAIFVGDRALGFVSDGVPLVTRFVSRRKEHLIVTSVGTSFHTYGASKLGLLSVSKIHPKKIQVLAGDTYLVFTGCGDTVYAWRRGTELKHVYKDDEDSADVRHILPFGPSLVTVDAQGWLRVWDIKSCDLLKKVKFAEPDAFEVTALCHPLTYKDKVLLGSRQGPLKLYNLKTEKQIYRFKGWDDSAVTCLAPCPSVLDAVAVGLASGTIVVHNLKFDEEFVRFRQSEWGPVTALSFRTDRTDILVSGSSGNGPEDSAGHVAIWDLNDRKLTGQIRDAHQGPVTGLQCLPGEPILVTSSPDNTVKQWIFDLPDGGGRLLRIKEGHSEPPIKIRFYGNLGHNILSASEDSSLRTFSTVTELLNKSFGVASYNRKLSKKHKKIANPTKMRPIVDFTTDTTREQEWDNIACVHSDTQVVSTWSFNAQKMGDTLLRHPRFKENQKLRDTVATCVCLTACGNFVLVGYATGHVDKFNIQSGLHRGELRDDRVLNETGQLDIRGICSDGLNQMVITGNGGGSLKYWRFSTHKLMCKPEQLDEGIRGMCLHRDNGLLAIATADFSVLVVDTVSRRTVRRFESCHSDQITDFCFSPDSRWVMTASLDSTVKVWDVPSGSMVDTVAFPRPVTSLTMSPSNDRLATTHVGDLGVYLWVNKTLYGHVPLKPLPQDFLPRNPITMPTVTHKQERISDVGQVESSADQQDMDEEMYDEDWAAKQIDNLVTLSNLPSSRWQHLLKLDVIKARNKPLNPVVKPVSAPFFLPTVPTLSGELKFALPTDNEQDGMSSRLLTSAPADFERNYSEFGTKLCCEDTPTEQLMDMLKDKGPSAIEVELQNLAPEGGGSVDLMASFLRFVGKCLATKFNYELTQSYLALFLKLHSDYVMQNSELTEALRSLQRVQEDSWVELKDALCSSASLVGFCKSSTVS